MSCEITTGYTKGCDSPGGVATVYAWATANMASSTSAAGEITALALDAGTYCFAFNVEIETATFNDKKVGERATSGYGREQSGTAVLHGNTASMIVNVENLAKGRHTVAVKLNDDTYEVFFFENGATVSDDRATGTAYEDMNGTTLTFAGKEKQKAMKISSSIILGLLSPLS